MQYDNWAEAQALCDSLGGFLAEPSTEDSAEVLVGKSFFNFSVISHDLRRRWLSW